MRNFLRIPIIARAFTKEILLATLFVLCGLIALFAFFDVMGRLGGRYQLEQLFIMTALAIPTRVYEVMPIAALLASVFVMSKWAAHSEFTILRVSGMSPAKLASFLVLPSLILVAFTYILGEFVAPSSEAYYREYQAEARYGTIRLDKNRNGTWVREVVSSDDRRSIRYINIRTIDSNENAYGWRIFEFSKDNVLTRVLRAEKGHFVSNQGWVLSDVRESRLPPVEEFMGFLGTEKVAFKSLPRLLLKTGITPEIFSVMIMKPESMSMRSLSAYISHLKQSRQRYDRYEIGFWNKAFYPLAIFVMIALSMPFAYMNARNGSVSVKIFAGVMIGLVFYTINNLFSYIGMLNTWPPIAVALLPTIVMLCFATTGLWMVEKR